MCSFHFWCLWYFMLTLIVSLNFCTFLVSIWNAQQIQNFGEPFFLVIHEGETLTDIKVRIQQKLQVPDEEFAKVSFFYPATHTSCNCYWWWMFYWLKTNLYIFHYLYYFLPFCLATVEICISFARASRVPSGLWHCIQSFSGAIHRSLIVEICIFYLSIRIWLKWYFPSIHWLKFMFTIFFSFKISIDTEKGCLWGLGAIPWLGAYWQCS